MQSIAFKGNIKWPFWIILIIVPLLVIITGVLFIKSQEKKIKYKELSNLAAIASLKVENISEWRMEHIRDGNLIKNNLPLNKQISLFFDDQIEIKQDLLLWMQSFMKNYDYQNIFLLDTLKTVRLSFPPVDSINISQIIQDLEISDYSNVNFKDLHNTGNGIFIDLVIPLISSVKNVNTCIGTAVLRINPEITLFPLIQSWPTPSKSSETLLLRREDDSVSFLNELRHKKNTALRLKLPLSNKTLPAAMAASGFEGEFEGLDYRNVPVISFLKKIPDSPWFMVAKVDMKEIYSSLNEQIAYISVIAFFVILSVSMLIGFYLRNQRIRYFKKQLESEIKRKTAEEAYHLLFIRNEAILASVQNIIMEVDKNQIYKWANQAGYDFFGNDVIGKKTSFYFYGEQDTYNSIEALYSGVNDKVYLESWHRRIDGEIRLLAWWCKSLKDENGNVTGILSSAIDITEQKKFEEELKENEISLRNLNASKDKFFSIISHDLRSPFAGIIGLCELLIEKMKNRDFEGTEEYTTLILNSSQSVLDLISNLAEWSRFQTGRMEFNPREVDIVSIIKEVTELLNASAIQKSITIIRNTPLYLNILIDKAMISTVLRNLISNSIKFSNQGSKIIITAVQKENEAMVEIRDFGVGIKKDIIPKLFHIETSFSTPGTQLEEGTGLGLILCKEFVSEHGGEIWAESEMGKGSGFIFTLPLKKM